MEVPKCEVHKQLVIGSHNPEIRRQEEFQGCGISCCQNASLKQISCSSVRMFQECGMSCCQNDTLSPMNFVRFFEWTSYDVLWISNGFPMAFL